MKWEGPAPFSKFLDLGIFITDNLKPSVQCTKAAAKAHSILGMVRRNFKRLDCEDFLLIYKTYIRPHLEYCIQSWSPYLQKDISCLESVQRAATLASRNTPTRKYYRNWGSQHWK